MNLNLKGSSNENIDLVELIGNYTKHWKWFLFSVLVLIAMAYVYLRYATPEYVAQAKILVVDDDNSSSGIDLFSELNLAGGSNKVEDEIQIINSRSNFMEVVKELGINIKVMALGISLIRNCIRTPQLKSIL